MLPRSILTTTLNLLKMEKENLILELHSYRANYGIQANPSTRADYMRTLLRLGVIKEDFYKEHAIQEAENEEGYIALINEQANPVWFPKEKFEAKYRSVKGDLNFGLALEAVKHHLKIARKKWNSGIFVFMRPADELPITFVRDGIKSLPESVKQYYREMGNGETHYASENGSIEVKIPFSAYLCLKALRGNIVNGWVCSEEDMLAEDWCILD